MWYWEKILTVEFHDPFSVSTSILLPLCQNCCFVYKKADLKDFKRLSWDYTEVRFRPQDSSLHSWSPDANKPLILLALIYIEAANTRISVFVFFNRRAYDYLLKIRKFSKNHFQLCCFIDHQESEKILKEIAPSSAMYVPLKRMHYL